MLKPPLIALRDIVGAALGGQAVIDKGGVLLKDLLDGRIPIQPDLLADAALLLVEEVIFLAEPEREAHPHFAHREEEGRAPRLVVGLPVGKIEEVLVPALVHREVIAAHPRGLEPHNVAGDLLIAEEADVLEKLARPRLLVVDNREAVAEGGEHHGLARDIGDRLHKVGEGIGGKEEEVGAAAARVDHELVGVIVPDVKGLAVGAVDEDRPSV